jgi:hypothetical protein
MINKFDAIQSLYDGAITTKADGSIVYHGNGEEPSEEAIEAKLTELQADYDAKQYQRDRAVAYPSIQDVVVALAEKEEGDDTMWKEITAKRAKVKADNPKPE